MKKFFISLAVLAVSAAAIVAVNANNRLDEQFEANVDALAQTESSTASCFGPKQTNVFGRMLCKCTNTIPCQDKFGCD